MLALQHLLHGRRIVVYLGSASFQSKSTRAILATKVLEAMSVHNDLRLISLTEVLSKILEGYLFHKLNPYQVYRVSTMNALFNFLHRWLGATGFSKNNRSVMNNKFF